MGAAVLAKLDEVDRKSLSDVHPATDRNHRAPMTGVVGWSIGRKPLASAQRWADHNRPVCHQYTPAVNGQCLRVIADHKAKSVLDG